MRLLQLIENIYYHVSIFTFFIESEESIHYSPRFTFMKFVTQKCTQLKLKSQPLLMFPSQFDI